MNPAPDLPERNVQDVRWLRRLRSGSARRRELLSSPHPKDVSMALGKPDVEGPHNPKSSIGTRLLFTAIGIFVLVLLFFLLGSGNDYTFGR